MKSRYQFRIYPTPGQRQSLARLFGCVRVVWNDALHKCKQSKKLPNNSELQKICITQAKKTEAREWLGQVSAISLHYKRTGSACKTSDEAMCGEPSTHREYVQLTLFD